MAAGQVAFSAAADVAALDALAEELAVCELDRGAVHVRQLRGLLRMHAVGRRAGMDLSTVPQAALALGSSQARAGGLLTDALLLGELAGALEAVECGLLSVEQSQVLVRVLSPVPLAVRRQVWERLQARLTEVADAGMVLPPARLAELLRHWVIEADAEAAAERRRQAQQGRRVDWRRRDDGLNDLFAFGFTGPDLQAVLSRVRDRAHPVGPDDPTQPCPCAATSASGGRAACGCLPGSPVPCGAELLVHVTLGAALGVTDQPAELVAHGPLEPDLLEALLLTAPRLRRVCTDEHGVPVAVDDAVVIPQKGDPASVRQALLRLAALPPPQRQHPRHPEDHPPEPGRDGVLARLKRPVTCSVSPVDAARLGAAALGGRHPAATPGAYRPPRRLRRLIEARAPRCEWPGCGARAARCDAEHDLAWPEGPTCACNLGPCCRRHHRVKQLGWSKSRGEGSAVTWTSPGGGRRWLRPAQHQPPAPAVRPLPALPAEDPLAELSPLQQHEELWWLADCPDDTAGLELRAPTESPVDVDLLAEHLTSGDTRWTLDLDDPYIWQDDLVPLTA